jgi:hypothetical protein
VSGGEVVVDSDGREGGHAIYVTKKRTRSVPPCVKIYGPKREGRDGPEERGRKVGLEREPLGWAGRGIGAGQREGERPREEGF